MSLTPALKGMICLLNKLVKKKKLHQLVLKAKSEKQKTLFKLDKTE